MHEGNFTQQIVTSIVSELEKHPGYRPQRIKVKVGEMLHLEPESVRTHYALLTKGTSLEGIALELEGMPVVVNCRACHAEGAVSDHHLLFCPSCYSRDVVIVSGNDVLIDSIELEQV